MRDNMFRLAAGIKEADSADFAVWAYFIDVELFHQNRYQDFGVL